MKTNFLFAAAALMALTACSSDDFTEKDGDLMPIKLAYTTIDAVETRAAQDLNQGAFVSGESVKVRISNTGVGEWTDYTFTTAADGDMTPPNPAPYYPAGSQNIDIAAYYPATAGTSFTVATDQKADASYKASDLMFASVTNQAKTASAVNLQFFHKMAKLNVNITAGEGVGSITNVSILNVKPTVSFDQATGVVGEASGDATSIAISNNGAAVIPAQTINGGLLSIVTDQGTATYSVNNKAFVAGQLYTMNITVNLRAVNANTDITGWISEGTLTVNPVQTEEKIYDAAAVELLQTELVMRVGTQENLLWDVIPPYASRKRIRWQLYGGTKQFNYADKLSPDDPDLEAWISPEGLVTAKKTGTITIKAEGTVPIPPGIPYNTDTVYTFFSEECKVTVVENFDSYAVDLGLKSGLKWASCNIGTNKPEEFGNFYAWGETKTKNRFHWGNYPYCGDPDPYDGDTIHWEQGDYGPNLALYKYNTKDTFHFTGGDNPDGITELVAGDDVATAQWGGLWRMPTKADWQELLAETTLEPVFEGDDNNDTKKFRGLRFTGSNGNSIFLPAAGSYNGNQHDFYYNSGNDGQVEYWSSTLDKVYPYAACAFSYDVTDEGNEVLVSGYRVLYGSSTTFFVRNQGRPIRAVYGDRGLNPETESDSSE